MSEAWRLRRLPGIPFERQASATAALREKAQLDSKGFWRGHSGPKMTFDKVDEDGKNGELWRPGPVEIAH
jgi:hypothetical protein